MASCVVKMTKMGLLPQEAFKLLILKPPYSLQIMIEYRVEAQPVYPIKIHII